jgi:acetoin utilization deacetylase AcuC-like enzyme
MAPGSGDRELFAAWERVTDHLKRHEPEFFFLQTGADSLAGDPWRTCAFRLPRTRRKRSSASRSKRPRVG